MVDLLDLMYYIIILPKHKSFKSDWCSALLYFKTTGNLILKATIYFCSQTYRFDKNCTFTFNIDRSVTNAKKTGLKLFLNTVLTSRLDSLSMMRGEPWFMRREEYPMFMAVSCLSPVKTQTLMSAFIRAAIVSGTCK